MQIGKRDVVRFWETDTLRILQVETAPAVSLIPFLACNIAVNELLSLTGGRQG